jgi:hypothetical protein
MALDMLILVKSIEASPRASTEAIQEPVQKQYKSQYRSSTEVSIEASIKAVQKQNNQATKMKATLADSTGFVLAVSSILFVYQTFNLVPSLHGLVYP